MCPIGSSPEGEVRQSMLALSWILEHLTSCGESWPAVLCSAWERQVTAALSASQSPSTGSGDVSTSETATSSLVGYWVQLRLFPMVPPDLLLPPVEVSGNGAA